MSPADAARDRVPPWLRLAAREYVRAFGPPGPGNPGGRDFLWLTALLGLVVMLAVTLIGVRGGLMDRFADSLLGKLESTGVPLWVMTNPERPGGFDAAARALFDDAAAGLGDLSLFPYHEIEPGDPLLRLPGAEGRGDGAAAPPLQGWAVSVDDPLWRWALDRAGAGAGAGAGVRDRAGDGAAPLPLIAVVNRAALGGLDLAAYRARLAAARPRAEVLDRALAALDRAEDGLGTPDHVAFDLRGPGGPALYPMRAVFVASLPALNRVAFLVARETYDALGRAGAYPALRYFPEGEGRAVARVRGLGFLDVIDRPPGAFAPAPDGRDAVDRLGDCLGTVPVRDGVDIQFSFAGPMPARPVRDCLARHGLADDPDLVLERVSGDALARGPDGGLVAPCGRLPPRELAPADRDACHAQGPRHPVAVPPAPAPVTANVYVPDRDRVLAARDRLQALRLDGKRVVYLNPLYQDALQRFAFLTRTLAWLQLPVLGLGTALVIVLLVIQISVVTGHRRRHYALLLTHGLRAREVGWLLQAETAMATLCGGAAGLAVAEAVKRALNRLFLSGDAGALARTELGLPAVTLVPPIGVGPALAVIVGVGALAAAVLALQAHRLPLGSKTTPTDLL